MGVLDRWLKGSKAAPVPLQGATAVGGRHVRPDYTSFQKRVIEGYMGNPVVAACVSTRANTLNEPPLVATNATTGDVLPGHPLTKLFAAPNPYMSQAMFWQTVSTYLDVGGNAYIVKSRNVLRGIVGLYPYNDGQVAPVVGDDGWVTGYVYSNGGKSEPLDVKDVIHLKSYYIDPLRPYVGLSPIAVASIGIDAYNELMDTLYSVAKNGGVIPGILSSEMALPAPVVEQLKEQFAEKIGGRGDQSGKPIVLSGGISYSEMGQSIANLATNDQFTQYEIAICGAFRIDPAVAMTRAGLLSSTYANKETAFREYTTLTRVPTWNAWEEQVGISIASEFPGVKLEFDTSGVAALQQDPDAVIDNVVRQFNANLITVDEARSQMGFPTLDDEERGGKYAVDLVVPAGPMVLGAVADAGKPGAIELDGAPAIANPNIAPPEPEPPIQYYRHDEKEAGEYWRAADKIMNDYANDLAPFVADGMDTMVQQLRGQKAGELDPSRIKIDALVKQYLTASNKVRESLMKEIFYLAVQAAEGNPSEFLSVFDQLTAKIADFQRDQLTTAYGTARDEIGNIVSEFAGRPEAELFQALTSKVDTLKASRAQAIARTVTRATASATQKDTWKGMNEGKAGTDDEIMRVWVTRRDDKVRPSHREMDGLYVTVDGKFPELKTDSAGAIVRTGKTLDGPALSESANPSSIVNCRCVIRPVRKKKITSGYMPASGAGE